MAAPDTARRWYASVLWEGVGIPQDVPVVARLEACREEVEAMLARILPRLTGTAYTLAALERGEVLDLSAVNVSWSDA